MKCAWKLCVILFLATGLVAQTASAPSSPKKKAATVTAEDVQALKDAIASQQAALAQQQKQIQELRDELHQRDQTVQQAQTAATNAAGKADAAQAQATQQQETVTALKSDVTDLKTNLTNTVMTLQDTQKNISASESPMALHYKGITITPGGFLAAETVRRSRALAADINTPFNNITMPGASQNSLSEFFGSGRQSRVSMLAEGRLKTAKLSAYVETDFLSAATTSNNNQSNSYGLRQRQAWGQAAFDDGWSFTGGQQWSLLTETKHGVDNRTEALPMTIDAQYQVGFTWARQYGIRLAKNFNNKVWFAVSMENSQATVSTHNNAANFLVGSAGAAGGLYNPTITTCSTSATGTTTCTPTYTYSFNPSPDIVAKAVFEPGFGHYEVFGVFSRFRDRTFPCAEIATGGTCEGLTTASALGAVNSSKSGGGIGANARWSFASKRIDFGLHGFGGSGIGRYGSAGLADASVHANGTLDLIRNYQGLATLEWHGPKLDVYMNVGAEYNSRANDFDPISGKYVGYGSPNFNNTGCYAETIPQNGTGFLPGSLANCTADTRALTEGTIGFWYRFYNGPKGRVQWGPQFSYANRQAWSGVGGLEPHGLDAMVFTSFRYYLP
ncbi:MAG: hypothetical protein ACLQBK_09260 [Candidatus Sulfotelmatobacter sp.]